MSKGIKLKVCGMRDADNIRQLAALNPDYIGFIFYAESKRYAEFLDSTVLAELPSSIKKTGVFVNATSQDILEKVQKYQLDAIQLHGQESPKFCLEFKNSGIEVIKAFGVDEAFDFNISNAYQSAVDYFLFDTKTPLHGGSGHLFNWDLLKAYMLATPYFLSGGISAEQVSDLLKLTDERLYALDLNSRFEVAPGVKDIEKLTLFFNEIRIPV